MGHAQGPAHTSDLAVSRSARTLAQIDRYYTDPAAPGDLMVSQVVRQLAEPRPTDHRVLDNLAKYKALAQRWQNWDAVVAVTRDLAVRIEDERWED